MKEKMYVRCPIDELINPREFICGQIVSIDEFDDSVVVNFQDPFNFKDYYDNIPKTEVYRLSNVSRCVAYKESFVEYEGEKYVVLSYELRDEWYYYYLQNDNKDNILKVREDKIKIPFLSGKVEPIEQLKQYEFQNPVWYFGRSVVSKTMKVLENSIYGFKELAGCKIFLMPHQLKTVMRCLQGDTCRYMIADEVGMGKTIEAASILKIFQLHKTGQKILIVVPKPLLRQWKNELFIKFGMKSGIDKNGNKIVLISTDNINRYVTKKWDFIVVDEAHKLLNNSEIYNTYHKLSKETDNILLLSATPVQQKQEDYLALLKLILPEKYDKFELDDFNILVQKQKKITKLSYLILQDLEDFSELINISYNENRNPHDDEECIDLFEDILNGIKKINNIIEDNILKEMIAHIEIDSEDLGLTMIEEVISYVCDNYQLERNLIRNRRRYMEEELAQRTLTSLSYELNPQINTYESSTYEAIVNWITKEELSATEFEKYYIPLLTAFFSSPWAFIKEMDEQRKRGLNIDEMVYEQSLEWRRTEENILENLEEALSDPDMYSSRIFKVIDFIEQEAYKDKVVIFTNYDETFKLYSKVLIDYFGKEKVALFNKSMTLQELELSIYRFQNQDSCQIILCDETGGEGRNLQGADYVVHIDLPWDANKIEQRIGRLDRLGRPVDKDVCSVVIYTENTLEEELFRFWNEGLNIFRNSLSGLEIIMNDINKSIINAVTKDFRYGITNAVEEIIKVSRRMEQEIREEQHFDTAAYIYRPINKELTRLLRNYTKNENEIFGQTMMRWANLAGLHGEIDDKGVVSFDDRSFSPASAKKALLIPPKWMEYLNKDSTSFEVWIRELYEEMQGIKSNSSRKIQGTFQRDMAIANDYLHFFAPGDEIFDCIVNNALQSYKGQCAAFSFKADIEWKGLVFTWSLVPNENLLLEKGISLIRLSEYRNYLPAEIVTTVVPFVGYKEISEDKVISELDKVIKSPISYTKSNVIHIGKREYSADYLRIREPKIEWFKKRLPSTRWDEIVEIGSKMARKKAISKFNNTSNYKRAEEEINRSINAIRANARYYGVENEIIKDTEEVYKSILKALKEAKVVMESAAYVWMVKSNDL